MALEEYKRKRHFHQTPEPEGTAKKGKRTKPLTFVVQKHAATRLRNLRKDPWESFFSTKQSLPKTAPLV